MRDGPSPTSISPVSNRHRYRHPLLSLCYVMLSVGCAIAQHCTEKELDALCAERQSEFRLELVQVVMRHGQRTPRSKEIYPTHPYNISTYEPWGLGQLTNQGKLTEYRIGTMLRERYNDFLGSLYHPRDIYAVSTDIDRTKMSLQLALAGLYPPDSIQLWNPNLPWLAIPTHYIPERVDILMKPYICPAYEAALEEVKKTKEVHDKIAFYNDFFVFLSKETGLNIIDPMGVYEVYNSLAAQKSMNLTMPTWCTDNVYEKMQDIVDLEYEIRSYTKRLKRLNGGMLIKRFIDNMDVTGERKNPRKMYIYSGHEVNVAAFARALDISEPRLPEYGSAFMFEKLRNETGDLHIRIVLWTGATEKFITIKLAGCEEICPLRTYVNLVRDVTPSDEETTCLWDNITKKELLELFAERINLD